MPGGSYHGVDIAEIFSQGMEYLSLCYADAPDDLVQLKMADCLRTYVEQAAYASFEQQVYALSQEELTGDGIRRLYTEVADAYGLITEEWDCREYVCIPHLYETPMYLISYVVSNDAAFQIYEMELQEKGSGLQCLEENIGSTQSYLLAFLEDAGLESPFATGRLIRARQTLESVLK